MLVDVLAPGWDGPAPKDVVRQYTRFNGTSCYFQIQKSKDRCHAMQELHQSCTMNARSYYVQQATWDALGRTTSVEHVRAKRNLLVEVDSHCIVKLYYSFQDVEYLYGGNMMIFLMRKNILFRGSNDHVLICDVEHILGSRGANDIKVHPWFKGIVWNKLYEVETVEQLLVVHGKHYFKMH
eukprot:Gb_26439 [translate_table: standard]